MEQAEGTEKKKKSATVMLIAAIAVLTLVGGGGGWVIGSMLAPKIQAVEEANKAAEAEKAAKAGGHGESKPEEGLPHVATEANGIVQLEPITTNLAYPSENWIRLEVALMFNGATDVKIAEDVHQDILAYLRTVSLQQIEGPRGFQYLKDDIQERVDLRSEGRVSKVMFRTFVIE
ncbi:flagellar basal body protein FliL [Rhizobium sp. KAs_5_22]|uniref:flagellar basal body-associated FliL family protein n=1 Tax=Ciceribacter selenitireducens TaxID=448181 RepID=UPI00048B03C1|nr:flagellar basal body-associated FliL family protein [Ciceribacter selenitireducens]PPJ47801.1 flagellar basal body protein FliL [Rhizobium sp. KAs_5_22]